MNSNQGTGLGLIETLTRSIILFWAIAGGFVLVCVVGVNTLSVIGGIFWKPLPGDYELTEIGIAIAVFAFLPYCHLSGANVTADIFTSRASPGTLSLLRIIASLIAFCFASLLLWKMYEGMINRYDYRHTTAILLIPLWIAYVPILISLVLLILASMVTVKENIESIFVPSNN